MVDAVNTKQQEKEEGRAQTHTEAARERLTQI